MEPDPTPCYEALLRRHFARFYQRALRQLGDEESAALVAQAMVLRVYRSRELLAA